MHRFNSNADMHASHEADFLGQKLAKKARALLGDFTECPPDSEGSIGSILEAYCQKPQEDTTGMPFGTCTLKYRAC